MAIDKIGSKALVDCSVAAADIAPGTITGTQLAGSIANAKLANSTVTINGTAIALGASASINPVSWQSVVVSDGSTVTTMVAGRGYFVNNTSAAGIVKLPISASAGDTVAIKDYAGNFATNKLTIQRNGHNIQGSANNSEISTNKASVQLVYIDATKGWLYTNESNVDFFGPEYVAATGGTVTTSGDFKIHTFTGDGNFVVSNGGNPAGSTTVDYLVVAGGGGAGAGITTSSSAGGAGGYRESSGTASGSYTRSPLGACVAALPVSASTYPVTVGAGGAGGTSPSPGTPGSAGSNSVFSTITSTGGGRGAKEGEAGGNGGSGGGGGGSGPGGISGGCGNTPPTSPSQGNNGGAGGGNPAQGGGAGGGATAVGGNGSGSSGGNGGAGATSSINATPTIRGGGGAGANSYGNGTVGSAGPGGGGAAGNDAPGSAGTANTGGGGGGAGGNAPVGVKDGGAGGKGIVILRYKFQN